MNKSADKQLISTIKDLELCFFDKSVRHSESALNNIIADDFIEFGSSGRVYNKNEIRAFLLSSEAPVPELKNFSVRDIGNNTFLVTYISEKNDTFTLRTSIWEEINGKWKILFHQGTPATHDKIR